MGNFGSGKNSRNDVSDSSLRHMMQIYRAKSEQELQDILSRESKSLPCYHCGKEYPIEQIIIICGEPYYKEHAKFASLRRR